MGSDQVTLTSFLLPIECMLKSQFTHLVWSYKAIAYTSSLWCQGISIVCLQSKSWRWLLVKTKKASSTLKVTNLLDVLFDKMFGPLNIAELVFWKKKTSASNCSLWDSEDKVNERSIYSWDLLTRDPLAERFSWC